MSGDALNKIQSSPFPLTVIEDCVLGVLFIVPERRRLQLSQLQFHYGNPPPAPVPSKCIRI